jgi:hypothetical protein
MAGLGAGGEIRWIMQVFFGWPANRSCIRVIL